MSKGKFELHISDVRTFKSCRRRWDWSSPLRRHLEPEHTPIYFLVGRAVHYALAQYYENGVVPADTFQEFMEKEIAGYGTILELEREDLNKSLVLGVGMLENYLRWVRSDFEPDKGFKTLATEMTFEVPIYTPNGKPSPRIFLKGRIDGILEDEHGGIWLQEYKTAARKPNERWLRLDDQATIYCWAVQEILGKPVRGIRYRFLMKKVPEKPNKLKSGAFSRAINSSLSTTYDLYMQALSEEAYGVIDLSPENDQPLPPELDTAVYVDPDEVFTSLMLEYDEVLQQLSTRGYDEYFIDIPVIRSQEELMSGAMELYNVGLEMVRPTVSLYSAADWLKCNFCPFKTPCEMKNAGADYELVLKHSFRPRREETPIDADTIDTPPSAEVNAVAR